MYFIPLAWWWFYKAIYQIAMANDIGISKQVLHGLYYGMCYLLLSIMVMFLWHCCLFVCTWWSQCLVFLLSWWLGTMKFINAIQVSVIVWCGWWMQNHWLLLFQKHVPWLLPWLILSVTLLPTLLMSLHGQWLKHQLFVSITSSPFVMLFIKVTHCNVII